MQRMLVLAMIVVLMSSAAAPAQENVAPLPKTPAVQIAEPAAAPAPAPAPAFVPPPADPAAAGRALALVSVGDVDEGLAEHVRTFAEENLAVAVRALPGRENAGGSLDDEGRALASLVAEDVIGVVALVVPEGEIAAHGVYMADEHVAVVNVKALRPEDGDEERFARRVERGTMQSLGMLMGLGACPNPQCVMCSYTKTAELDSKGRNLCPPCLDSFQRAADREGLTILRDSPFAPLR